MSMFPNQKILRKNSKWFEVSGDFLLGRQKSANTLNSISSSTWKKKINNQFFFSQNKEKLKWICFRVYRMSWHNNQNDFESLIIFVCCASSIYTTIFKKKIFFILHNFTEATPRRHIFLFAISHTWKWLKSW